MLDSLRLIVAAARRWPFFGFLKGRPPGISVQRSICEQTTRAHGRSAPSAIVHLKTIHADACSKHLDATGSVCKPRTARVGIMSEMPARRVEYLRGDRAHRDGGSVRVSPSPALPWSHSPLLTESHCLCPLLHFPTVASCTRVLRGVVKGSRSFRAAKPAVSTFTGQKIPMPNWGGC